MSQKLVQRLQQKFGQRILAADGAHGDESVTVGRSDVPDVLAHLRDAEGCEQLSDVVGIDHPDRQERFEVVYLLRSWRNKSRIQVRTTVAEDQPVPTVSGLYGSADWAEREVYDMFGIRFTGHPDLRRILLSESDDFHPLRKEYPRRGHDPQDFPQE